MGGDSVGNVGAVAAFLRGKKSQQAKEGFPIKEDERTACWCRPRVRKVESND